MSAPLLIVGSYVSPYVRKVLVCLETKGLAYEIDPIVPFYGNDDFGRLSPLRQVPVLVAGDLVLNDSTVICQYLEERYPVPALYPSDLAERAQARWLEEFADTRMGQVIIWQLFNQLVIRRSVWGKEPDQALLERTYNQDLPAIFDYLEGQLPESGWLFGEPSMAEISLACFIRNAQFARYQLDAARWPRLASSMARTLELPAFTRLAAFELICTRTPIVQQREALRLAGAPISSQSFGRPEPMSGVMGRD